MVEGLLTRVSRPARYLGNEWNSVHKDPAQVALRVALAYPDLYEIGMSHLGLAILYDILNRRDDCWAQRVYTPALDMEREMRRRGVPLFALESGDAVRDLDILGFTLPYEMTISNLLNTIDLAGIPVLAADRSEEDPIIIAGGVGAANPEPLASFVDAFVIGDGEEVIHEIADACIETRGRTRRMELLSRIEGVYIPALYKISYHGDGTVDAVRPAVPGAPERVVRRIVTDLDSAPFPTAPVVPHLAAVHDRLTIEIMRGCPRACRVCQARGIYAPPRRRSIPRILALPEEGIRNTGYDEISLLALSAGDYSGMGDLIRELSALFRHEHIAISLPSLHADSIRKNLPALEEAAGRGRVRKSGFTFAPETGSARMRETINKHIDDNALEETVHALFEGGHRQVKLYLMIGLPGETEDDLTSSIDLVRRMVKGTSPRHGINVSVSSFIPKPCTPFEREAMEDRQVLISKQKFMRKGLHHRRINFRWHDVGTSFLEAAVARGDRRLGQVLLRAWQEGARMDSWTESFDFQLWMDAFASCGLDPAFYASRRRADDETLPWAHIG